MAASLEHTMRFTPIPIWVIFVSLSGLFSADFFSHMWFSKGAFLRLSPLGFELKTPIHNRVKKVTWAEIEKIQILTIGVEVVGITYTEASGRRKKK
ncbi:hypothetical protein OAH17_03120 [Akkermansiaceae bacterium]|nr:hypothetical protein [Akkermansiaceae bacterium]